VVLLFLQRVTASCPVAVAGWSCTLDGRELDCSLGGIPDIDLPAETQEGEHQLGVTVFGNPNCTIGSGGSVACTDGPLPNIEFHRNFDIVVDITPPRVTMDSPAVNFEHPPGFPVTALSLRDTQELIFSGVVEDRIPLGGMALYEDVTWPTRSIEFPLAVRTPGSWSKTIDLREALTHRQFDLPRTVTLDFTVSGRDLAGNFTDFRCPSIFPPPFCAANGIHRFVVLDGTPPTLSIRSPANGSVLSALSEISGTAKDDVIGVKAVRVKVRDNRTSGLVSSGEAALAGDSDAWTYPVNDDDLVDGTSYTITAQALDKFDNISDPVEAAFTFDLCANNPPASPDQRATATGRLLDDSSYLSNCAVLVCGRRIPISANPGEFSIDISAPELRSRPRVACDDPSRQCPLPDGGPREDSCGDGGFNDKRPGHKAHRAGDFAFGLSRVIRSATTGTVIFVGQAGQGPLNALGSLGWIVVVKSDQLVEGRREYVVYAHLAPPRPVLWEPEFVSLEGRLEGTDQVPFASPRVRAGARVVAGQAIADGDSTGNANLCVQNTGFQPHLHVEAYHSKAVIQIQRNDDPEIDPWRETETKALAKKKNLRRPPAFDMAPFKNPSISIPVDPDKAFGCDYYGGPP
jgi:hypothetical protein